MPKLPPKNSGGAADETGDIVQGISGFDVGMRLVGAVLGLGALGLVVDRWLGWGPWAMLGGIFLGFAGWLVDAARKR